MSNNQDTPLATTSQKREPVYVTRYIASKMTGIHDRTIEKYAKPDAWRLERDGGLSPLYSLATVEAFRAEWQIQTAGGAE
jgi:hypothetical protein